MYQPITLSCSSNDSQSYYMPVQVNEPSESVHDSSTCSSDTNDSFQSATESGIVNNRSLDYPQPASPASCNNVQIGEKWRNLIAFWFLGLTNNFAFVVMLSAAHDILSKDFNNSTITMDLLRSSNETILTSTIAPPNPRDCNLLSTGIILLADIVPSLNVKMLAPFLGFYVHARLMIVVLLCSLSFLLVGFAASSFVAILGVICASASAGLGEATLLAYSSFYNRNVVSAWSSGTGGAGLLGAIAYAGLTSLGLSSRQSVLVMLFVPVIMSISFWKLLEHPTQYKCCKSTPTSISYSTEEDELLIHPVDSNSVVKLSFDQKLRIIPSLFKYMLPLNLVYMAEYLINQGLAELLYFPNELSWIDHNEQYRWYQVIYQIGVLISRSSVNIVYIDRLWLPAFFQWLNVAFLLSCAIFWWVGSIWVVFIFILWEGLLGGAAYVNTFYKLSKEVIPDQREFALQLTTLSDTLGVTFAAFLAIPLHNAICKLPIW